MNGSNAKLPHVGRAGHLWGRILLTIATHDSKQNPLATLCMACKVNAITKILLLITMFVNHWLLEIFITLISLLYSQVIGISLSAALRCTAVDSDPSAVLNRQPSCRFQHAHSSGMLRTSLAKMGKLGISAPPLTPQNIQLHYQSQHWARRLTTQHSQSFVNECYFPPAHGC
jgi:hypothetical protein